MAHIPNIRFKAVDAITSHPYIDTPNFAYDQWLSFNSSKNLPLGNIPAGTRIAVIGAGVSGACASYELLRAGATVDLFDALDQVGGRADSVLFPGATSDLAELGAMRFPPSEFIMNWYLESLGIAPGGIASLPAFPDPGVVQTLVSYKGTSTEWLSSQAAYPPGFGTVFVGWGAFCAEGLKDSNNNTVLESAVAITEMLKQGDTGAATAAWQQYINLFGQTSFYGALFNIFTGVGGNKIPGSTAWTFSDFDKFGALGIGSGGFGPLYPVGFTEIMRLVINELETSQNFLQVGIRSLPSTLVQQCSTQYPNNFTLRLNTPINLVSDYDLTQHVSTGFFLTGSTGTFGPYQRVIVATTTRSMEMKTNITQFSTSSGTRSPLYTPQLSADTAEAVKRTHVVSSIKVAARINNYWANNPTATRVMLSDTAIQQIYTLDYGEPGTGVCFITYTWEDNATKQQALGISEAGGAVDPVALYAGLLALLAEMGPEYAAFANYLTPIGPGNILYADWQSAPYFSGAFKLSQPGQDPYVQTMFYDYQKCQVSGQDTGLYLAGDCLAWTSGWIEGGLQTALNAVAGVIVSAGGTLNPDANGLTPLSINPAAYSYFPGT